MDFYGFYTGQNFDDYTWLGAHLDGNNCTFRTFAPSANNVQLLINGNIYQMNQIYNGNFYEITIDGVKDGDCYEYRIFSGNGNYVDHCDPYGYGMELRPNHKSIVRNISSYTFNDSKWMNKRNNMMDAPLNIYEIHAGSWKKPGEANDDWFTYDELATELIPYLKEYGYNYIEFLPLCEYPSDESWGYQCTGYFSPTSRYGTAGQLQMAIDMFHQNGIGVILDFVPAHFAIDDYALKNYDGTCLYEYPHNDVGVSEWGSCNFMHSRGEIRSFLQTSVNYWLQEFHFDGIRFDAVSRLLYWQGDERRGVNGNTVEFLKFMNKGLKERNKGIMLIAEDSTNFPNVTKSVEEGGLGFDYKWDLGWMHDTLDYFASPAGDRHDKYHKLTFSMMYFYNEKYLLPLSHDEVVHGKATIIQKMNGDYDIKFPQARALYMYMMMHPGKKLNFMGNEFGQFREWDEKRSQDWLLMEYPLHDAFHNYMAKLNSIYLKNDAFWKNDFSNDGFSWIDCHQEDKCIYVINRHGNKGDIKAIFNFSDKSQSYSLPYSEDVKILLNSDWKKYGGNTYDVGKTLKTTNGNINFELAPFSGIIFK